MAALRRWGDPASGGYHVAPLTVALAVAAAVELLILRTFTRTAIHIPAVEVMQGPYDVLAFLGRYAYFVSVALLMLALPALGLSLFAGVRHGQRLAAIPVAVFVLVAGAAAFGLAGRLTLDLLTLFSVVTLAGLAVGRWRLAGLMPFGMLALAFLASGGYTVLQSTNRVGGADVNASWLLSVGELSGVLFALSLPLLARRNTDRVSSAAGLAAAVVAFGMLVAGGGATSRILLLWNAGLSGTLPGIVYAVAAGSLAFTFVALVRARQTVPAMAVALLVAGGLGLHNTYQTGLVVAGLAALCLADKPRPPATNPLVERPQGVVEQDETAMTLSTAPN
ncbi:MAG: hypothetical protein C0506_13770 [Anaerolinea sp.]|nr:hypothetical protein [Anaerolinea sp.]